MRLYWFLVAWAVSLTMRPGVRYGGDSFRWHVLRAAILERDGHKCRQCQRKAAYGGTWLECHHKRPVAAGGSHSPLNLVTLCVNCHRKVHR